VASHASFVIGSAVAAVAAGRIKFPFDLVHRHEIPAMGHFTVGTVAVFNGGLHLDLAGVAVVAE
jgi:hypothetical protein